MDTNKVSDQKPIEQKLPETDKNIQQAAKNPQGLATDSQGDIKKPTVVKTEPAKEHEEEKTARIEKIVV